MHCLDAKTGEVIWNRDLAAANHIEMPKRGIAAPPLIEGDLLFLQMGGRPEACVITLDKHTGKKRWIIQETSGAPFSLVKTVPLNENAP